MTCEVETVEACGLSELCLDAGSEPAKWQLEPVTCSRALAVDGADIAGPAESASIVCLRGLKWRGAGARL